VLLLHIRLAAKKEARLRVMIGKRLRVDTQPPAGFFGLEGAKTTWSFAGARWL
jgi:hypothetical protein